MVMGLRPDSRVIQHLSGDAFTSTQHLIANICDTLQQIQFQGTIAAAALAGDSWKGLQDQAPERMTRPGLEEVTVEEEAKEEELVFTSAKAFGDGFSFKSGAGSIAHTEACISSGINTVGVSRAADAPLNCSCPRSR